MPRLSRAVVLLGCHTCRPLALVYVVGQFVNCKQYVSNSVSMHHSTFVCSLPAQVSVSPAIALGCAFSGWLILLTYWAPRLPGCCTEPCAVLLLVSGSAMLGPCE